jgi:hypothetical protein
MTTINEDFGAGGANLTPLKGHGEPTLAQSLRDIADDLDGLQVATIASPDATDLATVITLANEMKGALNTLAAVVLKTIKG